MAGELIKNVEHGKVNSRTLSQEPGCKVTMFAIDADEGMSSHSAPGDVLITVLEGTGCITVCGVTPPPKMQFAVVKARWGSRSSAKGEYLVPLRHWMHGAFHWGLAFMGPRDMLFNETSHWVRT